MMRTQKAIVAWITLGALLPLVPGAADALGTAASPWFWWALAASLTLHGRRLWPRRARTPHKPRRHRIQAQRRIAAHAA